jgi:ribonuclease HII
MPDYTHETHAAERFGALIAGIDEAGRGPLAGPVCAAAVILNPGNTPNGIDDSKKLSEVRREKLFTLINATAIAVGVGLASVEEIDRINILQATFLAMARAVEALNPAPAYALIDGRDVPPLPCPGEAIIKGDGLSLSIAAASIVAKVTRDRIMRELDAEFPGYGWAKNKGYGTQMHMEGLRSLGLTPHHRRDFVHLGS